MAAAYIENIKSTCVTVLDGLAVTFSYMFRPPSTVQYPDRMPTSVQDTLPARYRGHLYVHLDTCISCLLCEKACPIECIKIEDVRIEKIMITDVDGKPTPKVKEPTLFNVNMYKCMYCGLCTDPCPTGAIRFTKEFEGSTVNIQDLHFRFVTPDRKTMALALNEEQERKAAEKKKAHAATAAPAATATAAPAPAAAAKSDAAPAATATPPAPAAEKPAPAAPEPAPGDGTPPPGGATPPAAS